MTLVREIFDSIYNNFVRVGRGTTEIALKTATNELQVRNTADNAWANLRAGTVTADSLVLSTPLAAIARRQCVLLGSVNASGQPNGFTAPTGLTCQLGGNGTLIFSFADGFDSSGSPVDYLASLSSSLTLAANANATTYFYAERSGSTVTLGKTSLPPIYSRTPPSSPATGQHWFNTGANTASLVSQTAMRMYSWSGSVWSPVQRVFVGEAVAGGSTVTSVACYAYQRRYQSAWSAASANTTINFSHNLGMTLAEAEASVRLFGRLNSSDGNQVPIPPYYLSGSGFGARFSTPINTRLNQSFLLGDAAIYFDTSGNFVGSCELQLSVNGGW